jgi:hypothetical protein
MPKFNGAKNTGNYFIIYSELGDDFLLFHEWTLKSLTPEQLKLLDNPNFFNTEFGKQCNAKWKRDQKITSVHVYENGIFKSSGGIEEGLTYKMSIEQWWGIDSE